MKCEVFSWFDNDVHKEEHSVLHYYWEDVTNITDNVFDESIKGKFFINATNLNKQFFELSYDVELQFVEIANSVMYYRDQDPQLTEVDVPKFENSE